MILDEKVRKVRTNSVNDLGQFTIQASGKAFNILSKRIYSRPIHAIVRELSCNAYDSHVEAGKKEVPFRINLPSKLRPVFEIEDFGVGLPHDNEKMKEIYTVYFASTKTETNEQIGALGLGSKTPFAYIDSFTVISTYESIRITYSVYKNDREEPSIAEVGRQETTDCNGLKISFPVKLDDIEKFYSAAQEVLFPFPIKPIIEGVSTPISFKDEPILEGDDWRLYPYYSGYAMDLCIWWGNIEYKIDIPINNYGNYGEFVRWESACRKNDTCKLYSEVIDYLKSIKGKICLQFPLSYKFDFEPSRENLILSEKNICDIVEKLHDILLSEIWKETKKIADTLTGSKFMKQVKLYEFIHSFIKKSYGKEYLIDILLKENLYKGIFDLRKNSIGEYEFVNGYTNSNNFAELFYIKYQRSRTVISSTTIRSIESILDTYSKDDIAITKFVVRDGSKSSDLIKMKKIMLSKGIKRLILISKESSLFDLLNDDEFTYLSTLLTEHEDVWKITGKSTDGMKKGRLFSHRKNGIQYSFHGEQALLEDIEKVETDLNMYFFIGDNSILSYEGWKTNIGSNRSNSYNDREAFYRMLDFLAKRDGNLTWSYVLFPKASLNSKEVKNFIRNSGWVNGSEYIHNALKEIIDDVADTEYRSYFIEQLNIDDFVSYSFKDLFYSKDALVLQKAIEENDSELWGYIEFIKKSTIKLTDSKYDRSMHLVATFFYREINVASNRQQVNEVSGSMKKYITENYPLLDCINISVYNTGFNQVINDLALYIREKNKEVLDINAQKRVS